MRYILVAALFQLMLAAVIASFGAQVFLAPFVVLSQP